VCVCSEKVRDSYCCAVSGADIMRRTLDERRPSSVCRSTSTDGATHSSHSNHYVECVCVPAERPTKTQDRKLRTMRREEYYADQPDIARRNDTSAPTRQFDVGASMLSPPGERLRSGAGDDGFVAVSAVTDQWVRFSSSGARGFLLVFHSGPNRSHNTHR